MSLLINAISNADSLGKITDSPKPGTANSAPLSDEGEGMKNSATDANPREKVESPEAIDAPASGDPLRKRLQELQNNCRNNSRLVSFLFERRCQGSFSDWAPRADRSNVGCLTANIG